MLLLETVGDCPDTIHDQKTKAATTDLKTESESIYFSFLVVFRAQTCDIGVSAMAYCRPTSHTVETP